MKKDDRFKGKNEVLKLLGDSIINICFCVYGIDKDFLHKIQKAQRSIK